MAVIAAFAAVGARFMPEALAQDGWFSLVSGRAIVHDGLHVHDTLTIFTQGVDWVDQQWLAHIALYGLASLGGVKLVMIAHWLILLAAFTLAAAVARRRGASPMSVAWVATASILVATWGWQMRAQNFACPLFVGVVGLLMLEGRGVSRRTFLTLPLLALWANIHGSVLIGVGIVVTYALLSAIDALRKRAGWRPVAACAALALGAGLMVFVSPYGTSLVDYYRSVLGNHDIQRFVTEWRPATAYAASIPFFATLVFAAYVIARHYRRLTAFEIAVVVLTAAAGFQAIRNVVWFSYALVMVLPIAFDGTRVIRAINARRHTPRRLLPGLGVATFVVVLAVLLVRGTDWYEKRWPDPAASTVAAAVANDPQGRVYASETYADWLLWKHPELRGRVAYDARFELIPRERFRRVVYFNTRFGRNWQRVAVTYPVIVLGTHDNARQLAVLRALPGRRVAYLDKRLTVLVGPASDASGD